MKPLLNITSEIMIKYLSVKFNVKEFYPFLNKFTANSLSELINIIDTFFRKNNKLGLKRCVGTVYPNGTYLCPVLIILRALAFLKIGPSHFLFHKIGDKQSQILPSTLVGSIKSVQRAAFFAPIVTITDIRYLSLFLCK